MAYVNSCLMNGKLSIIINAIEADVLFEGLGSLGGGGGAVLVKPMDS
jgi:hypothetical protein